MQQSSSRLICGCRRGLDVLKRLAEGPVFVCQSPGPQWAESDAQLRTGSFNHTKLLPVDEYSSLIGSTHWDARSLRLNFAYNLACIDLELVRRLDALVDERIAGARRPGAAELGDLPVLARLRNGVARLMSPYL